MTLSGYSRLYRTVRTLTVAQCYARGRWIIYRGAYRRLGRYFGANLRRAATPIAEAGVNACLLHLCAPESLLARKDWARIVEEADAVREGRYTFLNASVTFATGRSWSDTEMSQLWRFQLHCFGCVIPLGAVHRATAGPDYYDAFRSLVVDWIRSNPVGVGDGWHPYTVSQRAVHWMMGYNLFADALDADRDFRADFLSSLAAQILYLRRHLEFDIGGNHLLENLRALVWAGVFFRSPVAGRWSIDARRLLTLELAHQILPDGCHYELSPMYHSIILWDLMEMLAVCRNAGKPLPEGVEQTSRRMSAWLAGVLHPDGEIPLFNDAVFGEAPSPESLGAFEVSLYGDTQTALPQGTPALRQMLLIGNAGPCFATEGKRAPELASGTGSGYFAFGASQGDSGWAVFDAGEPGPPNLSGHAHCDLLSYELSLGEHRFVVDTGVYQYAKGPWRDYCRGTRAHNTLTVDGAEQSEIWDSFRMGRRACLKDVRIVRQAGVEGIIASHDGFARLAPGLIHTRLFALVDGAVWFVLDRIGARGRVSPHRIESFVRWHPSVKVTQDGAVWRAHRERVSVACLPFGWDDASLHVGEEVPLQGWYCPEFGVKLPNAVLVLAAEASPPFLAGYILAPGAETVRVGFDGSLCTAVIDGNPYTLDMDAFGFVTRGSVK